MQQQFVINGQRRLQGEVLISGAKNAALPILMASLLSCDESTLHNVPNLQDIDTSLDLLKYLGVNIEYSNHTAVVNTKNITHCIAPYELVTKMRASILALGPLLARFKEAEVALPGGCAIGSRPVNLHLEGLEKMGAIIQVEEGFIRAKVPGRLQGCHIVLDTASVGGTENLMMAATLAQGTTIIENAAREPEVVNLAHFLNTMGAKVYGAGTDKVTIEGVERLHGGEFTIIPDRIETGTFLIAAVMTQGDIYCRDAGPHLLDAVIEKLYRVGAKITIDNNNIRIQQSMAPSAVVDIKTAVYPGFPTDMQAQFTALNAITAGNSTITETIFENRLMHVPELNRMGAKIRIEGNTAICEGQELTGAQVVATDLRASASLVLAGLSAKGTTIINNIYHIDRGYEHIEHKLNQLGADIKRVNILIG